jgi:hypothetical protein
MFQEHIIPPTDYQRQKPQPGDKEEPEDNFEDWIDNIMDSYISSTLIPLSATTVTSDPATTINTPKVNQQKDNTTILYSIIP